MINFVQKAAAEFSASSISINIPGYTPVTGYEWLQAVFGYSTLVLGPVLGTVVILFGAYKYVLSGGDQAKIKEGRDLIVGAIIGYVILLLTNLFINALKM